MNQKEVYKTFAQKLGVKRMSLQNSRLSDGKIYVEYFKQVVRHINKGILENKYNINPTEEFSDKSKDPWGYLNPNASLLDFAHLLAMPSSRTSAAIRAQCTHPRISKKMLTMLLADQLEKEPEEINLEMKVRDIRLPLAGYNKHSWVTFIKWCEQAGYTGHPQNLNEIADMTVNSLFDCWVR